MASPGASTVSREQAYYVLVGSDSFDVHGEFVSASDIAAHRLRAKLWPIYRGTRNRTALQPLDICLIYLGGRGPSAQCVIAEAEIARIEPATRKRAEIDPPNVVTDLPESVLVFGRVAVYATAVALRPLIPRLKFVPHSTNKWGSALQGGCRRIVGSDYEVLVSEARSASLPTPRMRSL